MSDSELNFESFVDAGFLQSQILGPENALDYFYNSKFFDTSSLNQKRRRGIRVPKDADGIEYRLVHTNVAGKYPLPPSVLYGGNVPNQFGVFVIQKFIKTGRQETPSNCYYIIAGVVYSAPSLLKVISARMRSASDHLKWSLAEAVKMNHWSLLSGYAWMAQLNENILEGDNDAELSDMNFENETVDEAGILDRPDLLSLSRIEPAVIGNGGDTTVIVVYEQRPPPHYSVVLESDCTRLFTASERLSAMFQQEVSDRLKTETERRDQFTKLHEWITEANQAVYLKHRKQQNLKIWLPNPSAETPTDPETMDVDKSRETQLTPE